jgi:ATP-dependent DNA helicase RecG
MMENQNTEWKESWRDEYLKWLCGFANAEGGVLVIGRNDQGQPIGVPDAKKLLVDLPNKIRDVLGIVPTVRLLREGGKELVEIRVESYPNPISYKGEYHLRSGSTKQELKGTALDRFLLRKYGRTWDSAPVPGVTARQLSAAAFTTFRKLANQSERMTAADLKGSRESLLEKLRLTEGTYLTRAAVLLFHPQPHRFFTGAYVKIGLFRDRSDVVYHDVIEGDLFTQASKAVELLRLKYMKAAISYQGIHRVETYPVPYEALREALLNAIIHRDYAAATPIQIKVYEDKMSIWNPGHLPENWTPEKVMQQHASKPFNPEVAHTFFRSGEIEMWGRGIEHIFDECRAGGFPDPVIEQEADGWWAKFTFPKSVVNRLSGEDAASTVKTKEKTREKILRLIRADPLLSTAELAEQLGLTQKGVEWQIQKLKADGILKRVGPARGGNWEIVK